MKVRNIVTFYPLSDEDQEVLMKELQHEEMLARLPEEYRKLKEYCDELTAKYNTLQEQNQVLSGRVRSLAQSQPFSFSSSQNSNPDAVIMNHSQPETTEFNFEPENQMRIDSSDSNEQSSLIEETDLDSFVIQGNTLIRYRGVSQLIRIPNHIAVIGATAFESSITIRRVILPESVVRIDEMAFANCPYLESVQFPNSLKTVNSKAFMNCSSLQSAEFHGALSQIGTAVFSGCCSIKSISFYCPIEKIGYDTFAGCISLQRIDIGSESYSYSSIGGVLFDYEHKYLIRYPAGKDDPDYIVPESVHSIEDGAFSGSIFLERVKLANNVKKIGAAAFRNCIKLRDVILSGNLETIKTAAFQGCTSLIKIKMPAWTTYIGTYAFSHCENLVKVSLPSKITELCMGVFEYCKALSVIKIPESVIKIGEKAFMESGLTEVFVPFSTTKIEKKSFAFCSKLHSVFLSNRINQIASDAFEGNKRSEMRIYGMMRSIPESFAIQNKYGFTEVFQISGPYGPYGSTTLIKYNGVFSYVVIPPDVNIIGENAFMGCKTIRSLEITSKVGEIKKSAFEQCENLESVTMTNLIVRIEERVFEGCNMLKQIQIIDMSQQYAPKTQRKIHRNFYNVLCSIRPESAQAYANQYNVSLKSPFLDLPFSKQQKKESDNYITRLSDGYQNSPFIKSIIKLVSEEANKSERLLPQIELFRDSFIISSVKVGKLSKRKIVYNDLGIGIRELPDINHILACATVLAQALGDDYVLSPEHNKGSAVIRPSIS